MASAMPPGMRLYCRSFAGFAQQRLVMSSLVSLAFVIAAGDGD